MSDNFLIGQASTRKDNPDAMAISVYATTDGYVKLSSQAANKDFMIYSPWQALQVGKLIWRAGKIASRARHQELIRQQADKRALETRNRIIESEIRQVNK